MKKNSAGKVLYALLFLVVIPLGQWYWAAGISEQQLFPAVHAPVAGICISAAGLLLMASGMYALKKFGKGLPMNAFPPPVFVKQGPYRFVRHPIYWGYGLLMTGVFIYAGSAAGLWVVTPVSILAIIALVLGYEQPDLDRRFKASQHAVLLDLPRAAATNISRANRFALLCWVLAAVALTNSIVLIAHRGLIISPLWDLSPRFGEKSLPGWLPFAALFPVLLVPFLVTKPGILRHWAIAVFLGLAIHVYLVLLWPELAAMYGGLPAQTGQAALFLPFFNTPVFLLFLSAYTFYRQFKKGGILFVLPVCVLAFCLLLQTPAFYQAGVLHIFIFLIAAGYKRLWSLIRHAAEVIANSWKEWVLGPVRIINHGIYAGLGAFGGILFCGWMLGPGFAWAFLLFAVVVTVCAALWAQLIEGSDKLKRPFGFYGAMLGIILASALLQWMGYPVWSMIGTLSVIMPAVQAAGRLRCLVNGCCHGMPTGNEKLGIRYYHPRSRVCTLSGMKGIYLHPTQLYSIIWLLLIGFVLLVLWIRQLEASFIFGLYLILTGLGRFVEEAYRGEVQTLVWNRLRLYQWVAIASVLAGIIFTLVTSGPVLIRPELDLETFLAAMAGGLFVFAAMGVDFPRSNARFSRLV